MLVDAKILDTLIREDQAQALTIIDNPEFADILQSSHLETALAVRATGVVACLTAKFAWHIEFDPASHLGVFVAAAGAGDLTLVSKFLHAPSFAQTLKELSEQPLIDALHAAAGNNQREALADLLRHRNIQNINWHRFIWILEDAAMKGYWQPIAQIFLLENRPKPQYTPLIAFECLKKAAVSGQLELVDRLLKIAGVKNLVAEDLLTIARSVILKKYAKAPLMLDKILQVPEVSRVLAKNAWPIMQYTIVTDNVDICNLLLKQPIVMRILRDMAAKLAATAIEYNAIKLLPCLLQAGLILNTTKMQSKAIYWAIYHNKLDVLNYLLALPQSADAIDVRAYHAMSLAVERCEPDVVCRMLDVPQILPFIAADNFGLLTQAIRHNYVRLTAKILEMPEARDLRTAQRRFRNSANGGNYEICHEYLRRLSKQQLQDLHAFPKRAIAQSVQQTQKDLSILYKFYLDWRGSCPPSGMIGPVKRINEYLFAKDQIKISDFHEEKKAMLNLFEIPGYRILLLERTIQRVNAIEQKNINAAKEQGLVRPRLLGS